MRNLGILAVVVLLCGCNANLIQGITLAPGQTLGINDQLNFAVSGVGHFGRPKDGMTPQGVPP